jgi:hypothetical protein
MAAYTVVHDLLVGFEGAPSGKAWFYQPGTLTQIVVFGDDSGTAVSNPVALNSGGAATVYLAQLARMIVQDVNGNTIVDTVINKSQDATVVNTSTSFTGATQKDINDAAGKAFGGTDYTYVPSGTFVGMSPRDWMNAAVRNVKAYGAKGDGVTPDDTAIAATVADVAAAGGGIVYFPPGTYLLNSAIALTGKNGVSFKGSGQIATTLKGNTGSANLFTFTNCNGFTIEDLGTTHTSSSTGTVFAFTGCGGVLFRNAATEPTTLVGTFRKAITWTTGGELTILGGAFCAADGSAASRGVVFDSGTLLFYGAIFQGGSLGTVIENASSSTPFLFMNNCFVQSSATGILIGAGVTGGALNLVGCNFSGLTTKITHTPATDIGIRFVNSGFDGYTEDVASGGAVTPNRTKGTDIRYRGTTTGVAYTVGPPIPAPSASQRDIFITFEFFNNAGGAVTGWTFNAVYHTTGAISTTDGNITTIRFKWDADASAWREVSRAVTT